MNHLKRYDNFFLLTEANEKPVYSLAFFSMLTTIFSYDLLNWLNANTNISCFYESDAENDVMKNHVNILVQEIDKVLDNQIPANPWKLRHREGAVLHTTTFPPMYLLFVKYNNLKQDDKWYPDVAVTLMNDPNGFLVCQSITYHEMIWQSPGFTALIERIDKSSDYFFDESLLKECGLELKNNLIQYYTDELVSINKKRTFLQLDDRRSLRPLDASSPDIIAGLLQKSLTSDSLFRYMGLNTFNTFNNLVYNKDFFSDVINRYKKTEEKLPLFLILYLLKRGCDITIPVSWVHETHLDAISKNAQALSLCKDNLPNLYQLIKSRRPEDQQWKTDLSADMGNLGF